MSVTKDFITAITNGAHVEYLADVIFPDGSQLHLTEENFHQDGCEIVSSPASSLPIGNVISRYLSLSLVNDEDQLSGYYFYDSHIVLKCRVELEDGSVELENLGMFYVTQPEEYGSAVTITAYDAIYRMDEPCKVIIAGQKVSDIVVDICAELDILFDRSEIKYNGNYIVEEFDGDVTYRQALTYCAMICCANAYMTSNNRLTFSTLSSVSITYDGGTFAFDDTDIWDGGLFNPWDIGPSYDAGEFDGGHIFHDVVNAKKATEYAIITGVSASAENGVVMVGTDGYVLAIENPFIRYNETDLSMIADNVIGKYIMPFEIDVQNYPVARVGDGCTFDYKGTYYTSSITDVSIRFNGYTTIRNRAEYPNRIGRKFYNSDPTIAGTINRSLTQIKKDIAIEEQNRNALSELLANGMGVFQTQVTQEDGSVIMYLHNKRSLEESDTIWRMADNAFMVSHDGGETYTAGISSEGELIANLLSVVGISFDWARGGTIKLGGTNYGNGRLIMYYDDGQVSGGMMDGRTAIQTQKTRLPLDEEGIKAVLLQNGYLSFLTQVAKDKSQNTYAKYSFGSSIYKQYSGFRPDGGNPSQGWDIDRKVPTHTLMIGVDGGYKYLDNAQYAFGDTAVLYEIRCINSHFPNTNDLRLAISSNQNAKYEVLHDYSALGIKYYTQESFDIYTNGTTCNTGYYKMEQWNRDVRIECKNGKYVIVANEFDVVASSKNRLVPTEYGNIRISAYETATPYFGDIGTGKTDEEGLCIIFIDDIFAETVELDAEYVVFLQKEGNGDVWIKEKTKSYFVVEGTPDLKFAWELKAIQKDGRNRRCEDANHDVYDMKEEDLEKDFVCEFDEYLKELEEYNDEDIK